MAKKWIVVAHRSGARIYTYTAADQAMPLTETLKFPLGRLRDRFLRRGPLGRIFNSFASGGHSAEKHNTEHEQVLVQVAQKLARHLESSRKKHSYDELILIAEPHLLGQVRKDLDAATARLISATVDKDLRQVTDHDMRAEVKRLLNI